ncbi:MAG: head morphogenesis protein [Brevundimonas sp.]|nr:head morphogenesis protein [Brevundimonas sp.]
MARRPTQRQLFRELAAKFGLEVALAFREAVNNLKSGVEFQRLKLAIEQSNLQAALEALHIDRAAFFPLEAKITEAFIAGGQGAVASMPAAVSIGFRFDPGNQRAASWIRQFSGNLITGLVDGERQQARDFLADGMARGAHPRSVGLELVGRISRATGSREGGLIGLSAPQRAYVQAARIELASADPKLLTHYLTRTRRDRRYDRTVLKAIREGKAIDRDTASLIVTRYSARLVQLRGEVIARTEGLPAIRAAKHEAYQQLVDDGRVAEADIERGWHTTQDGRQRDTHDAMGGQTVRGLSQPFQSPSGALLMFPGDTSLGAGAEEIVACRCDESISVRRAA